MLTTQRGKTLGIIPLHGEGEAPTRTAYASTNPSDEEMEKWIWSSMEIHYSKGNEVHMSCRMTLECGRLILYRDYCNCLVILVKVQGYLQELRRFTLFKSGE